MNWKRAHKAYKSCASSKNKLGTIKYDTRMKFLEQCR